MILRRKTGTTSDRSGSTTFEIQPTDIGQAVVRILIVTGVVGWSFYSARDLSIREALRQDFLLLSIGYWAFSFLFLGWTIYLRNIDRYAPILFAIKRSIAVLTDLGAISAYTALAKESGYVLYPIYLTTIIGYGYRFGLAYLYFSVVTAIVFFSCALFYNPHIADQLSLTIGYYLGLTLVPLYASSLLKKYAMVVQRLKIVNAARSRFIANMSHELRTPLHAIISSTDVLTEELGRGNQNPEKHYAKLRMIGDSAQLLLGLVNRVLDIASAEAGISKLEKLNNVDLYNVILRSLDICRTKAVEKQLEIFWHIGPEVPRSVISSEQHLREIMINIVGNAVKYTNTGSVHVRISSIRKNGTTNRVNVLIEVIDTGIGIPEEVLPTIFEPFTLGDDSAIRKYTGTGLGLAITKQYVEQLRGSISLVSTEKVGTKCSVSLPFQVVPVLADEPPKKRICALVTPRPLENDESLAFARAKWKVVPVGLLRATSGAVLNEASIVLIDREFGGYWNVAVDKIRRLYADKPLVLYTRDSRTLVGIDDVDPVYISRVRAGCIEDLEVLHSILDCLDVEDEVVDSCSTARRYKLLIADDNPTNLQTAVMALESVGHDIHTVRDGEEALDALTRNNYELALLDMHMPGMSGTEVAQLYQFTSKDDLTPIILITADVTRSTREEAEHAGVTALLTKPVRSKELRNAVQQYARRFSQLHKNLPQAPSVDSIISIENALIRVAEIEELFELGSSYSQIKELIDAFYSDSRALIDQAYDAATHGRIMMIRQHMHTIKGSAATIGATMLQKRAERIEKLSVTDMPVAMASEWRDLQNILERSKQALLNAAQACRISASTNGN